MTALVIEIGQECPGSICANIMNAAARATFAPGFGSAHADVCAPCATAAEMIRWYAGWYSTSSIRLPQRSNVFSSGMIVLASSASCWNVALPTSAPMSVSSPVAQSASWRRTPSASTVSRVNSLTSARGADWLSTVCVRWGAGWVTFVSENIVMAVSFVSQLAERIRCFWILPVGVRGSTVAKT